MSGPRLLIASRNPAKLREIRQILGGGIPLVGLPDVVPDEQPGEEDVEAFETFAENALAKARFFAGRAGMPALADDSGLAVAALGGGPGVHSKRFAEREGWRIDADADGIDSRRRRFAEDRRDELNNRLLLERLEDCPAPRRAHFACAVAFADPDSAASPVVALGTCSGFVASGPSGAQGFGYDPLFHVPALGRTFGEVDPEVKHRLSHRARAFRAMRPLLDRLIAT